MNILHPHENTITIKLLELRACQPWVKGTRGMCSSENWLSTKRLLRKFNQDQTSWWQHLSVLGANRASVQVSLLMSAVPAPSAAMSVIRLYYRAVSRFPLSYLLMAPKPWRHTACHPDKNSKSSCRPHQKPMAEKPIIPSGEATAVIVLHGDDGVKFSAKNIWLFSWVSAALSSGQRSVTCRGPYLFWKTPNSSECWEWWLVTAQSRELLVQPPSWLREHLEGGAGKGRRKATHCTPELSVAAVTTNTRHSILGTWWLLGMAGAFSLAV